MVRRYSDVVSVNQVIGKDLRTKEHEVEELLVALETANLQLETQQNVNAAIMRKKEEVHYIFQFKCKKQMNYYSKIQIDTAGFNRVFRIKPADRMAAAGS